MIIYISILSFKLILTVPQTTPIQQNSSPMHCQQLLPPPCYPQSSPTKLSSKFSTTHSSSPTSIIECPSCCKKCSKLSYYSCCIKPSCQNCYSGFHYLQCSAAKKIKQGAFYASPYDGGKFADSCQRCSVGIGDYGFGCKQCKLAVICENCSDLLHSGSKFKLHHVQKWKKIDKQSPQNILLCPTHQKPRKSLTQSLQLICPQCPQPAKRTPLPILPPFAPVILQKKSQIKCLSSSLLQSQQTCHTKWTQLREQLQREYKKVMQILEQKYKSNLQVLEQMEIYENRVRDKIGKIVESCRKEIDIEHGEAGIGDGVFSVRLAMVLQSLANCRMQLNNQQYAYKLSTMEQQKVQSILKQFTIQRQKLPQPQQKQPQNQSNQKHNPRTSSIQKPIQNNLSMSRRSLSKSVSKVQNTRNPLRDSTASISQSQNIVTNVNVSMGQQVRTQPLRNYTPPGKAMFGSIAGSSDKKSSILRQNSLLGAKMQQITPVMLSFDSKQIIGSRINFLTNNTSTTNKTQNQNQQNNCSLVSNQNHGNSKGNDKQKQKQKQRIERIDSNNVSQNRTSKRKSDYFQLRDRMRKTNVVNNRFGKR